MDFVCGVYSFEKNGVLCGFVNFKSKNDALVYLNERISDKNDLMNHIIKFYIVI